MYTFSEETKIQRYSKDLYAIMEGDKIVAYSEVKFEIPKEVRFLGPDQPYIFKGAKINGGNFMGGNFWGGNFRGGDFRGGNFWGGNFMGGDFRGGNYEVTLLQIQGSRHFCYLEKTDKGDLLLGIGCHKNSIEKWKEIYQSIGESEHYTQAEIGEYYQYIMLYDKLYNQK